MNDVFDHIVIGGGISGLTRAYYLQKSGQNVLLLEKEQRTGGVIHSKETTYGVTELGPNSLALNPKLEKLIHELGLENRVIKADVIAQKRYLFLKGKPVLINPKTLLFSNKIIGFGSKIKLLSERFKPAQSTPEESLADAVRRRFNDQILAHLVEPVITGIYAGSPEKLEYATSMKRLYAMEQEYGSFTKGFLASRKAGNKREIISFKGGLQALTKALKEKLQHVKFETVNSLEIAENDVNVTTEKATYKANNCSLAVPAHVAAKLLTPIDGTLARQIGEVHYPSLLGWQVTFETSAITQRIPSFGILFPSVSGKTIKGVIHYSEIFGTQDTYQHFTVFAAANANNRAQVEQQVREEFKQLYGVSAEPIESIFTFYEKAIPQFNVGHGKLLHAIEEWEKRHLRLTLLGNWRTGVAIGDCVND